MRLQHFDWLKWRKAFAPVTSLITAVQLCMFGMRSAKESGGGSLSAAEEGYRYQSAIGTRNLINPGDEALGSRAGKEGKSLSLSFSMSVAI